MKNEPVRINFRCKSCGKSYSVKTELAGKSAKCGCGAKIVIPIAAAPAALSQKLTTELILPPDPAKPDVSDEEYEIDAPIVRPVPEAIRRTIAQAVESSNRPPNVAVPPAVIKETGSTAGAPSRSGRVLLTLIVLVVVAALASLWAGQRVVNSAQAFSGAFQPYSGSRAAHDEGINSRRAELNQAVGAFELVSKVNLVLPSLVLVAYLVWLYASHSRLKAMRVANLRFTPGWAIGYQFVPFWNLIRPYQIMREIWHGSDPGEGVNNCGRGHISSNWLIRFWWMAALVLGLGSIPLLMMMLEAMTSLPPRPNVKQATEATIHSMRIQQVGMLLIVVYNVLLGLVVRSIERRQAARLIALNAAR